MKTKIDLLFEDLWGTEYEKINKAANEAPNITYGFGSLGETKKDSFEIKEAELVKLEKKAKIRGINLIQTFEDKLPKHFQEGKDLVKIGKLPVKCKKQFLLSEAEMCCLYVLTKDQQSLIQFIFEFLLKKGRWPFGSEILVGLKRKKIKEIIETFQKDELIIYIQHEEKYRLTPFGVIHAKGSKSYMKALNYVAKELKDGIQNGLEKIRFNYEEVPGLDHIKNVPKNDVASFLMDPWHTGGSITDEYFEINIPKDMKRTSLILEYTNPISFCRERYVKDYDQTFDDLYGISSLTQIESLTPKEESSSFNLDLLDEELKERCLDLFNIEKYDVVIFTACKVVEVRTRKLAQLKETDYGVDLMRKAFNPQNPKLKYSEIPAEQESVMHLFAGFIGTFKNPNSHRFEDVDDPQRAFEILNFANNLCKILNESTKLL